MPKVIFLDIDGTIIDYDTSIPQSAREAIKKAREAGNKVFLCTGCSKGEVLARNLDVEVDGMIGANGGYIEADGQVIFHKTFPLEDVKHFIEWCRKREMPFNLECDDGIHITLDFKEKRNKAYYQYFHGLGAIPDEDFWFEDPSYVYGDLLREDVNKVDYVLNSYQDYLDSFNEFPSYHPGTWGGVGEAALFGDLTITGVSKKTGVQFLLDYLHSCKEDAYGFGDAKSDIPMFESCGTSIAMGSGGIECKAAANYITDTVKNDGLYKAFQHFNLF